MAKGYWVVNMTITDAETYAGYQAFVRPFLDANGGVFVIRGGQQLVAEGTAQARTIVVEFPSYADAERVYRSAEYQAGMQTRLQASVANFIIVEGLA